MYCVSGGSSVRQVCQVVSVSDESSVLDGPVRRFECMCQAVQVCYTLNLAWNLVRGMISPIQAPPPTLRRLYGYAVVQKGTSKGASSRKTSIVIACVIAKTIILVGRREHGHPSVHSLRPPALQWRRERPPSCPVVREITR